MPLVRSFFPILAFATVYVAITLVITNSYYQLMMTLVLVWATFGLSWNILSGYTGLVSFGHAAFFGIGAYTTALGQMHFDLSPWLLIPIAALFGGLSGLLIGFPTFRLRSHYFALAMLAYPLAVLYVFEWLGYQEVTLPMKRENAFAFMQFTDPRAYTLIALGMMIVVVVLSRIIERSRFGMSLIAIKQNEAAAEAAGINTLAWKLRAIAVSGAIASATGAFYAVVLLVVTPASVFGMLVSAQALTVTMFGVGTGASDRLSHLDPDIRDPACAIWRPFSIQGVIFGMAIVVVILAAPEGLFWKGQEFARRHWPALFASRSKSTSDDRTDMASANMMAEPSPANQPYEEVGKVILSVRGLSHSFGGLKAVQNVSFDVSEGMILGIIGPNGAGKTTVFNLLNGFLRPDTGEILLHGRSVVGWKPHEMCNGGVGRTFQIMRPFSRLSVIENVVIGSFVHARDEKDARRLAEKAIDKVGLSSIADRVANELTTKQLRLMELARALAGRPRLLLLDETLAGLGREVTTSLPCCAVWLRKASPS
jgi:branched-chain amino acid transport system permease protein